MATTWIKLNQAALGYAAGATIAIDTSKSELNHLVNSGIATVVANPGGTPPVYNPGSPVLTAGAQAASVAADTAGISDACGSVSATALATGMAAGPIVSVTFGKPAARIPEAIDVSDRSAVANSLYVSAKSATGFTISSRVAATASQALLFDYSVSV